MITYIDESKLMSSCFQSVFSEIQTHLCKDWNDNDLVVTTPTDLANALHMPCKFIYEEMYHGQLQHLNSGSTAIIDINSVKSFLYCNFFIAYSLAEIEMKLRRYVSPSSWSDYLIRFFRIQRDYFVPSLLTVEDCSELLHISKSSVYRLLNKRSLPYFRFGNMYRIPAFFVTTIVPAIGWEEFVSSKEMYQHEPI